MTQCNFVCPRSDMHYVFEFSNLMLNLLFYKFKKLELFYLNFLGTGISDMRHSISQFIWVLGYTYQFFSIRKGLFCHKMLVGRIRLFWGQLFLCSWGGKYQTNIIFFKGRPPICLLCSFLWIQNYFFMFLFHIIEDSVFNFKIVIRK